MSQRTPIWPYVMVLACLFALALIAPRGWDHFGHDEAAKQAATLQPPTPIEQSLVEGAATVLPAHVQPAGFLQLSDADPTSKNSTGPAKTTNDPVADGWQFDAAAELNRSGEKPQEPILLTVKSTGPSRVQLAPTGASAADAAPHLAIVANRPAPAAAITDVTGPIFEIPAPAVLEFHRDVSAVGDTLGGELSRALHALALHPKPPAVAKFGVPAMPSPPAVLPQAEKSKIALQSPASKPNFGTANATDLSNGAKVADATRPPKAWPLPKSLLDSLQALSRQDDDAVRGWVVAVAAQFDQLNQLSPPDVYQAEAILKSLRHEVEQATALAASAITPAAASEIRRVQYAMIRRLDIWDVVCDERQTTMATNLQAPPNRHRMELCLADVNSAAEHDGTLPGLREHLMLDTLAELAKRDDATADQRRHVAREVLGRIAERRQAAGRTPLVEQRSLAELDQQLRQWVSEPVEGEELLTLVERYESEGRAEDARRLAEAHDQLAHSKVAADNELARRLDSHYRNANVRVALTAQLMNRWLPEQRPIESPVNDTILGTPVRGRSTTSTELTVRLMPNPRAWQLALDAVGNVDSRTSSTYGPVTFVNQGAAQFWLRKQIVIDAAGIHAQPAAASVDSNSQVAGIRTDYDAVPVVRSIVRNYAMSQRQQKAGQANQEADEKIRQTACSRVDSQVEPWMVQVEKNFRERILALLDKLELHPAIATLETTETRLTVRSRLAGNDQLAAYTPRPDAPADSLASLQMHESAVNNLLDHLDLAGRTFTLPELNRHLNERLSRAEKPLPRDLPEGVEVSFAKTEPMRIHCEGGRIEFVLNIAEIRQGKRRWHDFEVRAMYRPEMHGLGADLQRDGSIELGGLYKGKTEVALRGIFSKVLSRDRKINLLPSAVADDPRMANLQVTQFVVEDGWIALAIGPTASVARKPLAAKRF